jgi:hypothetical protein
MDGAARNAHVGAVSVPSETIATQRGRRLRIEDMIIVVMVERERELRIATDPESRECHETAEKLGESVPWYVRSDTAEIS